MPTPRLPWFKFWIGATAHAKARQLSDGEFRTWIELLDACAQQSLRGRFPNRKAAAALVRRPTPHIGALIRVGLIDEAPDQSLTMHDWDDWQRWRKEDANDSPSPTDQPPNGHGITNGTTDDQLLIDPAPLRVEERREKRELRRETVEAREETEDERIKGPRAEKRGAPPGNPRVSAVIQAFREFSGEAEPPMNGRDFAAIKSSTAEPPLIAETYLAVAGGEWGDDFQRKRLSVHEACDWVPAYLLWRDEHGIEPMQPHYREAS